MDTNPNSESRPRPSRRRAAAAAMVAVALLVTGVTFGRATTPAAQQAQRAAPPDTWITASPVRQQLADRRSGSCTVKADSRPFELPAGSGGIVTSVSIPTGKPMPEATTVLELSGRPVITLRVPFPLYRTINPFDDGPDVVAVQQALAAAGLYPGQPTGVHDTASQAAVRSLYGRAGALAPSTGTEAAERVDAAERAIDGINGQLKDGATVSRATIDAALAERTAARRGVGVPIPQAEIVAPPDGKVSHVEVAIGSSVGDGNPIATTIGERASITCTLPTSATTDLPERPRATVHLGDEDPVRGSLGQLQVGEQGSTASFTPDTPVPARLAGTQATVSVTITATDHAVLTVPATAMREGLSGPEVRVLEERSAKRVPVTTGLVANGWVEVRAKGLDVHDRVVLAEPKPR